MRANLRSTRTLLIAGALVAVGAIFVVANAGAGKKAITAPAPISHGRRESPRLPSRFLARSSVSIAASASPPFLYR